MFCKDKSAKKKLFLRSDFRPIPNKNIQMLDHFFPLHFPKNSESLKILDIRLLEVGAKRPLNGTSKVKKSGGKKLFFWAAILDNFQQKKCSYLKPFLSITFPQGFRISKNIGHPTSGSGAKIPFIGTSKVKKWGEKNFLLRGNFRQFKKKMFISEIAEKGVASFTQNYLNFCYQLIL